MMKLWVGVAALTQGIGWMQKAPSGLWNVALLHNQHGRFLQMLMPTSSSFSSSSSSTTMFGSNEDQEKISQAMDLIKDKCHLDVQDIAMKVGMLIMTSGSLNMPTDGSLDVPTSELSEKKSAADQVALVNLMNEAWTPVGEQQCSNSQNKKFLAASERFATCIGLNEADKVEIDDKRLIEINDKCDASSLLVNPENCTDAVLSDELIGGALRDLYQHPVKYCSCLKTLKEEIPACTMDFGKLIDDSGEKVPDDFDEAFRNMKFSLGFFKSELCAIGLGCDALSNYCVDELQGLEKCLSEKPACEGDSSETCAANFFFSEPAALSQGLIPDLCLTAYEQHNIKSTVVDDYANFVHSCHPEVATLVTTTKASKPSNAAINNNYGFVVAIGVVALAVLGLLGALFVHMRKQEQGNFEPVNTDEADEFHDLS